MSHSVLDAYLWLCARCRSSSSRRSWNTSRRGRRKALSWSMVASASVCIVHDIHVPQTLFTSLAWNNVSKKQEDQLAVMYPMHVLTQIYMSLLAVRNVICRKSLTHWFLGSRRAWLLCGANSVQQCDRRHEHCKGRDLWPCAVHPQVVLRWGGKAINKLYGC